MARLVIDIKDTTKEKIVAVAIKKGVSYKKLILLALGIKDE
jgi:hypothetical protein